MRLVIYHVKIFLMARHNYSCRAHLERSSSNLPTHDVGKCLWLLQGSCALAHHLLYFVFLSTSFLWHEIRLFVLLICLIRHGVLFICNIFWDLPTQRRTGRDGRDRQTLVWGRGEAPPPTRLPRGFLYTNYIYRYRTFDGKLRKILRKCN